MNVFAALGAMLICWAMVSIIVYIPMRMSGLY